MANTKMKLINKNAKEPEKMWRNKDTDEGIELSDELDLVKLVTKVYGKNKDIDENFILPKLSDKEKEYIRKQYMVAQQTRNFMILGARTLDNDQEKQAVIDTAFETFNLLMSELKTIAVLQRNRKDNPMVMKIIIRNKEQAEAAGEEAEEKEGIVKRILGKIAPKEKEPQD